MTILFLGFIYEISSIQISDAGQYFSIQYIDPIYGLKVVQLSKLEFKKYVKIME